MELLEHAKRRITDVRDVFIAQQGPVMGQIVARLMDLRRQIPKLVKNWWDWIVSGSHEKGQ